MYSDRLTAQIGVSLGGLMLMTGVASYRTWSRKLDAPPPTDHGQDAGLPLIEAKQGIRHGGNQMVDPIVARMEFGFMVWPDSSLSD
jgi:hypothetical protein